MADDNTVCTYSGLVEERYYGEAWDIIFHLFVGSHDEPLADLIEDDMTERGRFASVRYWVTDEPRTREELDDGMIRTLEGDLDAKFHVHYSEIIGYLWTDEELTVGGHDLLEELRSFKGKYLYLEIAYATIKS